jgi:serine/threonine protein kinase
MLKEGQDFLQFTLLNCISENDSADVWVALDRDIDERVCLKLFKQAIEPKSLIAINDFINRSRGLIHPNIIRTFAAGHEDGNSYVSQQYINDAEPLELDKPFTEAWPVIDILLETLKFAHELSFVHGAFHPGNVLVDSSGHVWISNFGLALPVRQEYTAYLSRNPDRALDSADDVYSAGAILHQTLTGQTLKTGEPQVGTLPADVQAVIKSMVEISDYDRTRDLAHVREVLSRYATTIGTAIALPIDDSFKKPPEVPTTIQPAVNQNFRERSQIPTSVAFLGFIILFGIAAFVFLYLPENSTFEIAPESLGSIKEPNIPQPVAVEAEKPPELAPMEIAQIEFAKEDSQRAATDIIRLQVELEDLGVVLWAKDRYDVLTEQAIAGDDHYREEQYREAHAIYEKTITELQTLSTSSSEVLARTTLEGTEALEAGDAETALQALVIATGIDRIDQSLEQKLVRAENLNLVLESIRSGESTERNGELDTALDHFKTASDLDPLWQPAKQGVSRIRTLIRQRDFANAMSEAFTALLRKEYDLSRQAFDKAEKILPSSTEPEDGILQIELAIRMDKLDDFKKTADQHIVDENWQGAIDEYNAVLAIDETLIFANEGLSMAQSRLTLDQRLQRFLQDPTIINDDGELSSAKQVVVAASRVANQTPQLKVQINDLSRLISVARIPIPIVITSDQRTDVTVYQVAQFGKMSQEELSLNPGIYTIVGKRKGYRDVQHTLRLLNGAVTGPIHISCTEKI